MPQEINKQSIEQLRQFASPEEELEYLREKVQRKEKELEMTQKIYEREEVVQETIEEHKTQLPQDILAEHYRLKEEEMKEIIPHLAPEVHDEQIRQLLLMVEKRGIKNTMGVVEKMEDPHLGDDFHRVLIQYIKEGMPVQGLKTKGRLWLNLNMTLFEIVLPEKVSEEDSKGSLRELISSMEQFYSGMLSITNLKKRGKEYFTLELAVEDGAEEVIMYSAVPNHKVDLFEKHLLAVFPSAQIREQKNDYNIFVEGGSHAAAFGTLRTNAIFPLKTYENFDYDPINSILNAFSKIEKQGGGASIQLLFHPVGQVYTKQFQGILKKVNQGDPIEDILGGKGVKASEFVEGGMNALAELFSGKSTKQENEQEIQKQKNPPVDPELRELMQDKVGSPIIETNIRIVASAKNKIRAEAILSDLISTFNQFTSPRGNSLKFKKPMRFRMMKFLKQFSFRQFSKQYALPLNIKELTTIMHFPPSGIQSSPHFRQSKSGSSAVPINLPKEGTLLGVNIYRNTNTFIYLTKEDRSRHFYAIGQTGTGKTTLLKSMIIQDIKQGEGVCMIDPHGTDIQDILASIPEERYNDVIYFDPGNTEHVMGLNMLEIDPKYPEQKTFVVNELFSIFQKLYAAIPESMGPMFEQYFRNATTLVLEHPESGSTLLDVSRVLVDAEYRKLKLHHSNNPVVNQFWEEIASKASGESSLANIVPYITSKFDVFMSNEIMRPIIAQQKSSFNFRQIMDERKILLVNLSKGKLGDINANLLGLIIVGKLLMAALSRVDSRGENPPFYLYIDEFQNITTDSIATILSEARKYGLSLNIAHQFIAQLKDNIRDAVFGNVGTIATFRTGPEDAEFLEKQFKPVFSANDIMNIDNYNTYIRLLANGVPQKPFSMVIYPPEQGDMQKIENLKNLSYANYGRPREEVEREIRQKYKM